MGEGSASRPGRSLPPRKTRYPLYRRLGGSQGRSGQVRKTSPPPGFDPRTVQPVASHYIDWATRPTQEKLLGLKQERYNWIIIFRMLQIVSTWKVWILIFCYSLLLLLRFPLLVNVCVFLWLPERWVSVGYSFISFNCFITFFVGTFEVNTGYTNVSGQQNDTHWNVACPVLYTVALCS